MNDHIFNLFIRVIKAAESGNFCHGNGAIWCIVEDGKNVVINTMNGTVEFDVNPNPVAPHTCNTTVRSLEQFLMNQEASCSTVTNEGYTNIRWAKEDILRAHNNNEVLYFNGGQCWVLLGGMVSCYETALRGKVTITRYGRLASWQYLRASGGYRQQLSEESIKFFRSL